MYQKPSLFSKYFICMTKNRPGEHQKVHVNLNIYILLQIRFEVFVHFLNFSKSFLLKHQLLLCFQLLLHFF